MPIDPDCAWEFDPDAVCTVGGLLNQLNSSSGGGAQASAPPGGACARARGVCAAARKRCPVARARADSRSAPCREPVPSRPASAPSSSLMQGEEPWRATDMSQAVDTFRACFLDALQADVKAGLAEKARQAAAAPTLAW